MGAASQIRPGRFALPGSDPNAPFLVVEPLRQSARPIFDPAALLPRPPGALTPSPSAAGTWIASLDTALPTGARLVELSIQQDRVAALRALPGATTNAPVVSLATLGDGSVVLVTAASVARLTAVGLTVLFHASSGESFVDVHPEGATGMVVLARTSTGTSTLRLYDPVSGIQLRRLAIPEANRLAPDPTRSGFLVGDRQGGLWFVDGVRFVPQWLTSLPRPRPIEALSWNSDRSHHLVAAGTEAFLFDGRLLGAPIPLASAAAGPARYLAYASSVAAYGPGCAATTGGGVPATTAWSGTPQPGSNDFTILLRSPVASTPAWLMLGLGARDLPLDALGLTGCRALVDPLDALANRAGPLGTAVQRLPIPADPVLVGSSLFAQWFLLAPGSNRGGALTSDGLRVVF